MRPHRLIFRKLFEEGQYESRETTGETVLVGWGRWGWELLDGLRYILVIDSVKAIIPY